MPWSQIDSLLITTFIADKPRIKMMSLNGEVMKSRSSLGENDMELENHQSNVDRRLSFSLNEEQRKVKSFQERTSDVDQAINWILNELVSGCYQSVLV